MAFTSIDYIEHKVSLVILISVTVLLYLLTAFVASVFSEEKKPAINDNTPISFSADRIVSNLNDKSVTLTGKAFISQNDRQISADQITIVFSDSSDTKKNAGNDKKSEKQPAKQIDRLTATGNVSIIMGERKAVTTTAVYTASDKKLVLKGAGSKVSGPEGELVCDAITLDQLRSVSECTGGSKSRASGIIFSDKNGF
jgi:lipopolysaccharide export system protein LptA